MESTRLVSRTGNAVRVWLDRDETIRLPNGRHGFVARVEGGTLVVTQTGDPEDHVLAEGDAVRIAPRGLAVAWALAPAVLVLEDAGRTASADVHEAAA